MSISKTNISPNWLENLESISNLMRGSLEDDTTANLKACIMAIGYLTEGLLDMEERIRKLEEDDKQTDKA